jgi:hypothetical protein
MIPLHTTLHCITKVDNTMIIDSLKDYLGATDFKRVSAHHVIFILDKRINYDESMETFELFQDDLGIKLYLYSGFVYDSLDLIQTEINLLATISHQFLYTSLYEVYINTNLIASGLDATLFWPLINIIHEDHETLNLIKKLWETQGNIAQSASELYIHRNTLIYRIDKFKEVYLIDLKNPFELLIMYLLSNITHP